MKKIVFAVFIALLSTGCENKTETGALVGAGIGVGAGALISHSAGGALIGGAVGAAAGGIVGYALDQQDRENLQQNSPNTLHRIDKGHQLTIHDVKSMSDAGIKDDVIIQQIKNTGSVYHLSADDIIDLKNSGVSQKVIEYMQETSG